MTPLEDTYGDDSPGHRATPPVQEPADALAVGATLAGGRYRIVETLGRGGSSVVLGAFDTQLRRPVAIKVMSKRTGTSGAIFEEARLTAAAPSPHVVAVYAVHLDETPPFFVMERVSGESLAARLASGGFAFTDALALLRQLAAGLDALHASGLVHGDVKPSNVLIDASGVVKIVDFGISALVERMTDGQVLGTPSHMPPERARGLTASDAYRTRGDVYQFAVVAYRVLTGRLPFEDADPDDMLRAHVSRAPPRPSEVSDLSPAFDAPLLLGLAKDPAERPASAGELVRALERASSGCTREGRQLRVLVVDDDDDLRELLSSVLETSLVTCEIGRARNGPEALAMLSTFAPNVAVVDLVMPGLVSGVALLRALHAGAPGLGLVVVTGRGSGPERVEARALGVRHFLIKPVEPVDLVRAVREAADGAERAGAVVTP